MSRGVPSSRNTLWVLCLFPDISDYFGVSFGALLTVDWINEINENEEGTKWNEDNDEGTILSLSVTNGVSASASIPQKRERKMIS